MKSRSKTILHVALFALLTVTAATVAQAQSTIRAGVKVGLNASTLTFNGNPDSKEKFGFQGGLFAQIPAGTSFAIQPELLYTSKGVGIKYTLPVYDEMNTLNLDYLELPILATFKLGNSVDLQVGPYAAYLLSSKIDAGGFFGSAAVNLQGNDAYKKFDYGLAGGINAYVSKFLIGLRYSQGLTSVIQSEVLKPYFGDNTRNVVATVSIGYSFN